MKKHLLKISGLLGAGILILCFQNCSDMVVQDSVIYQSSLAEYQQDLDSKNLSTLTTTSKIQRWAKPGNASYIDKGSFLSERYSIVLVADSLANGQIASVGNVGSEELRITSDKTTIRVYRLNTASDYSYIEAKVPATGSKMVIAATVGSAATDLQVLVNGIVQTSAIKKMGTPYEFSYVDRTVILGASVVEAVVYGVGPDDYALSLGQLNVMSRYLASSESVANVIYDPYLMTVSDTPTTVVVDTAFIPVKAILDNNCLDCHGAGSMNGDFSNSTAAKLISRGFVVAKSPASSPLYNRLRGGSGSGTKNMPDNGGQLSAADIATISNWISGL